MTRKKRRLFMAVVMTLCFLPIALPPAAVQASFCTGDSLQDGDVVFSGKVLKITHDQINPDYAVDVVLFRVIHKWRGASQSQIVVYAGEGRDCGVGNCGYHFEAGKSYLVFAYSQSAQLGTHGPVYATLPAGFTPTPTPTPTGDLTTDKCSRTALLSAAGPDLAALGPGYLPAAGRALAGPINNLVAYLLVVLALTLTAAGLGLRRFSTITRSR